MQTQTTHTTTFVKGFIRPDRLIIDELCLLTEQYFKDRRDPAFYSNCLHVSLRRLNRLTNYYCQKTVYQLLQERLHQEAEMLLRFTTMSAKQVAFELGVCDPAHFSKCFKKMTGMRPLEFRRLQITE